MPSEIAKKIILEELKEQSHPEAIEDVIFCALDHYSKSIRYKGISHKRIIADYLKCKILEEEAKAKLKKGN